MEEEEPVVADTDAPPAKTKKGIKGYPKGTIDHKKSGKLQVRLSYQDENRKTVQRPIPNSLFGTMPEAVAAQAAAQQLLDSGGVDAVWSKPPSAERNKRVAR